MELDNIRKELDKFDNMIKNMLVLRMSLIPVVTDIKVRNDIPLFQGKREEEIYKKIKAFTLETGVSPDLVIGIYKQIIGTALKIEEDIAQNPENSVLNANMNYEMPEELKDSFAKLDNLVEKEIPEVLASITKHCGELNLNQLATIHYNEKIKMEEGN